MTVFEITPEPGFNPCTEKHPGAILVWLEEAEPGDVFTIRVKEMTEAQYDALPEYQGP